MQTFRGQSKPSRQVLPRKKLVFWYRENMEVLVDDGTAGFKLQLEEFYIFSSAFVATWKS